MKIWDSVYRCPQYFSKDIKMHFPKIICLVGMLFNSKWFQKTLGLLLPLKNKNLFSCYLPLSPILSLQEFILSI